MKSLVKSEVDTTCPCGYAPRTPAQVILLLSKIKQSKATSLKKKKRKQVEVRRESNYVNSHLTLGMISSTYAASIHSIEQLQLRTLTTQCGRNGL